MCSVASIFFSPTSLSLCLSQFFMFSSFPVKSLVNRYFQFSCIVSVQDVGKISIFFPAPDVYLQPSTKIHDEDKIGNESGTVAILLFSDYDMIYCLGFQTE